MRNEVKAVINRLDEIRGKVAGILARAEDADYPNDDRIDELQSELDRLDEAIETLQDIE